MESELALNEKIVSALPAPKTGNRLHYFSGAKLQGKVAPSGFAVRVTAAGAKSFVWFHRVNGKPYLETLGRWDEQGGDLSVREAIIAAQQRAKAVRDGLGDPRPERTRRIEQGNRPAGETVDDLAIATNWFESSMVRWAQLVATAAAGGSINFPNGHFAVSYRLSGNLAHLGMAALVEALGRATVRHTGWPEFTVMRRQEIAPYIHNGAVECWMARDGADHGPAHNDFWRASPDGNFFLIRGHQEDEARHGPPRSAFDITLPAWRVGEALLHASNMASELGDPAANVTMIVEWTGLAGRSIISLDHSRLLFADQHHAQQNTFRNSVAVQADQIRPSLPELVGRLIIPLYELFDFFRLPAALPAEEMTKMQRHQF